MRGLQLLHVAALASHLFAPRSGAPAPPPSYEALGRVGAPVPQPSALGLPPAPAAPTLPRRRAARTEGSPGARWPSALVPAVLVSAAWAASARGRVLRMSEGCSCSKKGADPNGGADPEGGGDPKSADPEGGTGPEGELKKPWTLFGNYRWFLRLLLRGRMERTLENDAAPCIPFSAARSASEKELLAYLRSVTVDLDPARLDEIWGMGNESGQMSFTSRRYHLAFAFYAVVAAHQNQPDLDTARPVLDWLLTEILAFRSWRYARDYWPDEDDPFGCAENVMWLGHVLMMVQLYDALLGDQRFRECIATGPDETGRVFTTTTGKLAAHIAAQYRASPRGGLCCEPNLVFFACQNHALTGLRFEQARYGGDFADIFARWEEYGLSRFRRTVGGGAFQLCEIVSKDFGVPIGHLGNDGWCVAFWPSWSGTAAPSRTWANDIKPLLLSALPDMLSPAEDPAGPTGKAPCLWLDIPRTATLACLYAAASSVQDAETAAPLGAWLRRQADGSGRLPEGRDWSIGPTAQFLLGEAQLRGAALHPRAFGAQTAQPGFRGSVRPTGPTLPSKEQAL